MKNPATLLQMSLNSIRAQTNGGDVIPLLIHFIYLFFFPLLLT